MFGLLRVELRTRCYMIGGQAQFGVVKVQVLQYVLPVRERLETEDILFRTR